MGDILLADAGSSKTDWALIKSCSGSIYRFETEGINPAVISSEQIGETLKTLISKLPQNINISQVLFYGAGCHNNLSLNLFNQLNKTFPESNITVDSDILAAGEALFGDQSGIACILGTGSNACIYNQGQIIDKVPSLGYILGDEGSGADLGKVLLNHIFKRKLKSSLTENFFLEYNLDEKTLIEKVYKNDRPSAFLASFTPFILKNINDVQIHKIVTNEFINFFKNNVLPLDPANKLEVGIVGSIGWFFRDILNDSAKSLGIHISKIIKSPIDELVRRYASIKVSIEA